MVLKLMMIKIKYKNENIIYKYFFIICKIKYKNENKLKNVI